MTLDSEWYHSERGLALYNEHRPMPPDYHQVHLDCLHLLETSPSITYLNHDTATIRLTRQDGPRTVFKVFGSPYSPGIGEWAFQYRPEKARDLWAAIPLDTDIVVTHTPPKNHCDKSWCREVAGCEVLRQTLWRVRPQLAICGHVHESRGIERVRWDLSSVDLKYKEDQTSYWKDPGDGNKKQSLVDLSARSGDPLDNDGGNGIRKEKTDSPIAIELPKHKSAFQTRFISRTTLSDTVVLQSQSSESTASSASTSTATDSLPRNTSLPDGSLFHPVQEYTSPACCHQDDLKSATRGQGGIPPSGQSDLEALTNRLGRRETCIINAAITARSWPYTAKDGRKYNKAIVIDIDLPVWEDQMDS